MTIHILLIDDEPSLVGVLRPVLAAAGYRVTTAIDGASGAVAAAHDSPDVVLLDLGLPDMDGKEVIRGILARCKPAIIVISARHQESEKIAALDEGEDDYVNKPFEIGELMARIRAAVRRRSSPDADLVAYQSGPLAIEFATRKVTLGGEQIKLSPKEYELLQTLALNAGQVVTHKRLLAAGWGTGATDAQYLRVYIGMLRQKIEEDPGDPLLLLTEPGVGYRLAANA